MAWLGSAREGYKIAKECVTKLEKLDHPTVLIRALYSLTVNSYFLYLYEEQIEACNRMKKLVAELEDIWLQAYVLFGLGLAMISHENFEEAREIAKTNLTLFEQIDDTIGTTLPLIVLGHAALGLGELDEAKDLYLRCLNISLDTDFYYSMQTSSKYLAKVALNQGRLEEAEEFLHQSLTITNEIGFVRDIVNLIFEYARLLVSKNEPEKAIALLALVIEHPASDLYRMMDGRIRDSAVELLDSIKDYVSPEVYQKALGYGQSLDLDEITVSLIQK
jgi:tetratricopeptide (TPR) repeat protein